MTRNRSNTVELKKKLGGRIRLFREAAGLTQEQLAERADISVNFAGTTERGQEIPSVQTCGRIAAALGVSLHELFRFEEDSERSREVDKFATRLKAERSKKKVRMVLEVGEVILKKG
jgi:transcriptional regulator with XRE-family HTH domain